MDTAGTPAGTRLIKKRLLFKFNITDFEENIKNFHRPGYKINRKSSNVNGPCSM